MASTMTRSGSSPPNLLAAVPEHLATLLFAKAVPVRLAADEVLFLAGDPARGIPPCQGCHGAEARGPSISTGQYAAYPSLRGQYAETGVDYISVGSLTHSVTAVDLSLRIHPA